MQEPGLAEIIPFTHTSPVWDQCPVFTSGASFPRGSPSGVAAVWWLLDSGYSSPSWIPSGLSSSHQGLQSLIWLWHPCLLIQQEIFHFTLYREGAEAKKGAFWLATACDGWSLDFDFITLRHLQAWVLVGLHGPWRGAEYAEVRERRNKVKAVKKIIFQHLSSSSRDIWNSLTHIFEMFCKN